MILISEVEIGLVGLVLLLGDCILFLFIILKVFWYDKGWKWNWEWFFFGNFNVDKNFFFLIFLEESCFFERKKKYRFNVV